MNRRRANDRRSWWGTAGPTCAEERAAQLRVVTQVVDGKLGMGEAAEILAMLGIDQRIGDGE